ncbi:MAG: aminopeptidase P N-terminal domain-containing protein [Candidatus Marinimicrobia bacterium]|nr:aminopeptidase P N-terminal domain-containing protein [Candidatus Neomarinimicrobiota bacterium]
MSRFGDLPTDEFARRRAIFLNELADLDACAIIHSAPGYERNHDVEYPYRQDSDFIYLTGWPFARGILVLTPQPSESDQAEATLFVPERNSKMEVWTGPKAGLEEASALTEIDQALAYDTFFDHLGKLVSGYERLVISDGNDLDFQIDLTKKMKHSRQRPILIQEAATLLKSHRLIKSDAEIKALEQAIAITGESLVDAFKIIPTLRFEYEAKAEIEYGFKKRGAIRLGFPSIVGAGKNSTYLHYEDDRGKLNPGDILLMDVGAEWEYYSADISRTVPVNGTFSTEQALLYQLVLDAQIAAIKSVRPGAAFREPHHVAVKVITKGLIDLGLLEGTVVDLIKTKAYRKFFMHGTSHWLGLDVHDAGGYLNADGQPHLLKTGMILTVEPGIYISESDDVDPKWWNIGIRVEDDVLVTTDGHRVLSASIPKTIDQIERLMQP